MVRGKLFSLLVLLGLAHYYAYTWSLSTWSSSRKPCPDESGQLPNLKVGFSLICFQRLSLPNIATQQCPWQEQLVHQRFVLFGPLVLEKTPLKQRRLRQIETNLSHACLSHIAMCMDYTFTPINGRPTFSLYGVNVLFQFFSNLV